MRYHSVFLVVQRESGWYVTRSKKVLGSFSQRDAALMFVDRLIQERCRREEASQVIIRDDQGQQDELFCRCFDPAPPETCLN